MGGKNNRKKSLAFRQIKKVSGKQVDTERPHARRAVSTTTVSDELQEPNQLAESALTNKDTDEKADNDD